jgi:hypothetical protein
MQVLQCCISPSSLRPHTVSCTSSVRSHTSSLRARGEDTLRCMCRSTSGPQLAQDFKCEPYSSLGGIEKNRKYIIDKNRAPEKRLFSAGAKRRLEELVGQTFRFLRFCPRFLHSFHPLPVWPYRMKFVVESIYNG